jgi:AcrR family transcriptional regulator
MERAMTNGEGGNRRGRRTRDRLLAAGWELLDELPLQRLFELIPARDVAERAGHTEGALHHHFPTADAFVDGLINLPIPSGFFGAEPYENARQAVVEALSEFTPDEVANSIREAARNHWSELNTTESQKSFRREQILRSRIETDPELRMLLQKDLYERLVPEFGRTYEAVIRGMDREVFSDFSIDDFTNVLIAISEGFLSRAAVEPDAVSSELVERAYLAVAYGFTVGPSESARCVADREAEASRRPRLAEVGHDDVEIAVRCEAFFTERAPESEPSWSWSDLSNVTGMPILDMARRFPSQAAVAALAFAAQLGRVESAAAQHRDVDADRSLADGLCELARAARANLSSSQALLRERTSYDAAAARRLVPLGDIVAKSFDESDTPRAERLVDTTLTLALAHSGAAPAQVASWALAGG